MCVWLCVLCASIYGKLNISVSFGSHSLKILTQYQHVITYSSIWYFSSFILFNKSSLKFLYDFERMNDLVAKSCKHDESFAIHIHICCTPGSRVPYLIFISKFRLYSPVHRISNIVFQQIMQTYLSRMKIEVESSSNCIFCLLTLLRYTSQHYI